ncbi:MAG: hypothetical protein QF858_01970 [Candidatus Pacebacteria bacterium]|jgi:hypothetical protein|nr:hypothetical protein [bacterium]MDP6527625.1 hypothetical protein [Candidatus Paceibacterota bacterium]MDP6659456.1 hypothetical protein [Candidatus Paceibacterota bacterium]|tara:strand:- start:13209 stop:13508 length:300 start_codon:yes stop_codon:yes gene_type:complete
MGILKKYKNILIGATLIALAFVGYNFFFSGNDGGVLTSVTNEAAADAIVGKELLALLLDLKSIDLDESIFDDPAFRALLDFGRDIVPEPVGRENPFAPL